MTETKRRIKELKALLPGIREKVISVALLLAMSLAMVASASYAWYTLSFAPEVSQITTTLSSNGSLEVALAGLYDSEDKLIAPGASAVGDSFSEKGTAANLTWGNLINLSNAYGIESLVLRPATLREGSDAFLSSVDYGSDGRYENAALDFGLTSWTEHDGQYSFMVTDTMRYGVRAISSVTFPDGKSGFQEKLDAAEVFLVGATGNYQRIVNDETYLTMIQSLMNVYISAVLSDEDADCTAYIDGLTDMLDDLNRTVIQTMGEALAGLANAQMSLRSNTYTPYTADSLHKASATELTNNHVDLGNSLTIWKNMYTRTRSDMAKMESLVEKRENGGTVLWSDIVGVVNNLIEINTATINDIKATEMMDHLGEAASMALNGATIIVYNGTLCDIEKISGSYMHVSKIGNKNFTVSALGFNIRATFHTTLYTTKPAALYYLDEAATEAMADSDDLEFTGAMVAGDTYGMVIDLWVRTNAANSYLMLDGLAEVEIYYERVVHKILEGNELVSYDGWLYTYGTGEMSGISGVSQEITLDIQVYQIPEDLDGDEIIEEYTIRATETGEDYTVYEGYFYDATSNERIYRINSGTVTDEPITYEDVYPALEEHQRVVGFSSSNRVEDHYSNLAEAGTMSATQGSGSCYIFYADPEDSAATLELLSHMRFAFFSANGTKLAIAKLDTEHPFAEGGKYIVPMVLIESLYTMPDGDMCITGLTQNEATLISTVVYLDGQELENSMVMAADSVRSSMNLQFASSADLKSLENDELALQSIALNAALSGGTSFEYTGSAHTNQLTAYVAGLNPTTVEAIFQRRVNANQGSQMEPVPLTFDEGQGAWIGTPSFTMPGTYVLSSLWVDGVEYPLPTTLTVTVSGLNVTNVTFPTTGSAMVMTAESSETRGITVKINADENTRPTKVTARFESDEGTIISAPLNYNSTYDYWEGDARFHSSGTYTLTSLMMDGSYFEVDSSLQKSITVYLGLRARIRLVREEGLTFKYMGGTEEIEIMAEILTDTNESLRGLTGVVLTYGKQGSTNPENGLEAELEWDGVKGYYYDKFEVKSVGTFNFTEITANGNVITVASAAPTIRSQSMEPPRYNGNGLYTQSSGANNLSPSINNAIIILNEDGATAYYGAQIANASGATSITAVLVHNNNAEYIVTGELKTIADVDIYVFAIPNTIAGNKNGEWKVTEIRADGVYNGELYYGSDDENAVADYYTLTVSDSFMIVDEFNVTLGDTLTVNTSAGFMTAQPLEGNNGQNISLSIGLTGVSMPEGVSVSNVVLTLRHDNRTTTAYGGYTYTAPAEGREGYELVTLELTYNEATGKWHSSNSEVAYTAGEYYFESLRFDLVGDGFPNMAFTYGDTDSTKDVLLKVYSVAPTVTIKAISPSASVPTKITYTTKSLSLGRGTEPTFTATGNATGSRDNYNATVYAEATADNDAQRHGSFTRPTLTLTFGGLDNGCTASVTLPAGSASEIVFSRTGNGDVTKTLGLVSQINSWKTYFGLYTHTLDAYYGHGTQQITTLTVVKDGVTFTITLDNVLTINNPSSVNQN